MLKTYVIKSSSKTVKKQDKMSVIIIQIYSFDFSDMSHYIEPFNFWYFKYFLS